MVHCLEQITSESQSLASFARELVPAVVGGLVVIGNSKNTLDSGGSSAGDKLAEALIQIAVRLQAALEAHEVVKIPKLWIAFGPPCPNENFFFSKF